MFGMLMAQEILGWICEFGGYQAIVQAVLTGLASQNECDNVCEVINAERRLTVRKVDWQKNEDIETHIT